MLMGAQPQATYTKRATREYPRDARSDQLRRCGSHWARGCDDQHDQRHRQHLVVCAYLRNPMTTTPSRFNMAITIFALSLVGLTAHVNAQSGPAITSRYANANRGKL